MNNSITMNKIAGRRHISSGNVVNVSKFYEFTVECLMSNDAAGSQMLLLSFMQLRQEGLETIKVGVRYIYVPHQYQRESFRNV